MVIFQACATSPRLHLPSLYLDSFLPLGKLDETTIQGCSKPFWLCGSGNPICHVLIERFVLLIVLVGRWEQAWLLAIVCSMVVEDVLVVVWMSLVPIRLSAWFWFVEGSMEDSQ